MNTPQPATVEELQSVVLSGRELLPAGGGSKPALSTPVNGATRLDMGRLAGIIEYDPGEYTFTAYAGTPVQQVVATLAEHGQYLPFDPILVKKGATLGGMVAANTSGSGRYRYGGVRDFILGVHFVDGQGQLVRSGGKVVKNSAGFDLPKFMVGSLGRFGILVDVSFKVFPAPRAYNTLTVIYPGLEPALQAIYRLATMSFDIDALDLEPGQNGQVALLFRIGGLPEALPGRMARLQQFLKAESQSSDAQVMAGPDEAALWERVRELSWVPAGMSLVKVPLSPRQIPAVEELLAPVLLARRYSAGGNVAWLAVAELNTLNSALNRLGLAGLVLFGPPGRPYVGARKGLSLARRVKQALDPSGKFLEI